MSHWIIVPARKGSKGLPGKNRKLFDYTINQIPENELKHVIVTTDDEMIHMWAINKKINTHWRKPELSNDEANIRDVLLNVILEKKIQRNDLVIMLYLTYPKRTWEDILKAWIFFKAHFAKSLLCREEQNPGEIHPYRWFIEQSLFDTGQQLVKHDLYRRQDYPKMFKASHYIFMGYAKEIKKLNKNLWNKDTVFFPTKEAVDVDTIKDFEKIKEESK
jgi:CMP-N,N'-diacetyllegionaminic acid synthase